VSEKDEALIGINEDEPRWNFGEDYENNMG
jgi:hypothetical protein